jgi:hypothetical protein
VSNTSNSLVSYSWNFGTIQISSTLTAGFILSTSTEFISLRAETCPFSDIMTITKYSDTYIYFCGGVGQGIR